MKTIIYTEYGEPDVLKVQDIKELVEKDKIRPVIDRAFKIDQAPEAHRHAESADRKGDVVIKLGPAL